MAASGPAKLSSFEVYLEKLYSLSEEELKKQYDAKQLKSFTDPRKDTDKKLHPNTKDIAGLVASDLTRAFNRFPLSLNVGQKVLPFEDSDIKNLTELYEKLVHHFKVDKKTIETNTINPETGKPITKGYTEYQLGKDSKPYFNRFLLRAMQIAVKEILDAKGNVKPSIVKHLKLDLINPERQKWGLEKLKDLELRILFSYLIEILANEINRELQIKFKAECEAIRNKHTGKKNSEIFALPEYQRAADAITNLGTLVTVIQQEIIPSTTQEFTKYFLSNMEHLTSFDKPLTEYYSIQFLEIPPKDLKFIVEKDLKENLASLNDFLRKEMTPNSVGPLVKDKISFWLEVAETILKNQKQDHFDCLMQGIKKCMGTFYNRINTTNTEIKNTIAKYEKLTPHVKNSKLNKDEKIEEPSSPEILNRRDNTFLIDILSQHLVMKDRAQWTSYLNKDEKEIMQKTIIPFKFNNEKLSQNPLDFLKAIKKIVDQNAKTKNKNLSKLLQNYIDQIPKPASPKLLAATSRLHQPAPAAAKDNAIHTATNVPKPPQS